MPPRRQSALAEHLFWTAEEEDPGDFTPEDPLALDYLGQQIGNRLFPGFTTRTNRAHYYAVLVYGLELAERQLDVWKLPRTDESLQRLYERFERIWAMAICHSFDGKLPGDESIRGKRGVERAYGDPDRLPIDYRLISRQLQLGGVGAFLTSLRHHRLVEGGGLRVTPLGREIASAFFFKPGENKFAGQYDEFLQVAMEPGRKYLPAKNGVLTLYKVGESMRLSRIRQRPDLQERLHGILFRDSPDATTRALARILVVAHEQGLTTARPILEHLARGKLPADADLRELAHLACVFADLATTTRAAFDDGYRAISGGGHVVGLSELVAACVPSERLAMLRARAAAFLACAGVHEVHKLPIHGAAFVQLARQLVDASATAALTAILAYHHAVQRERAHGGGWLRASGDRVQLQLASYEPYEIEPDTWIHDFKIHPVRTLLSDLGRLP